MLVPVLERSGFTTGIDLYALLDAAELAERELMPAPPVTASMSIVSGLAGVFSGFKHRVVELSGARGWIRVKSSSNSAGGRPSPARRT